MLGPYLFDALGGESDPPFAIENQTHAALGDLPGENDPYWQ
jgi:hypothetical protein